MMKKILTNKSGKTKLVWILLAVVALTIVVSSQIIFAQEQISVTSVDVSSATDVGLDATKGVNLDWIDSESSATRRCLLVDINADVSPQDIEVYIAESDFNMNHISSSSLEQKVTENYDVPTYKKQCSNVQTELSNGTFNEEVCEWVPNGTTTQQREVWQDVSVNSEDSNTDAKVESFTLSADGDYKYCFDVPLIERYGGSYGNKGTVYAKVNGEWLVDKQNSSWWDASYNSRREIFANTSSGSFDTAFLVNGTWGSLNQTCWISRSLSTTDTGVAYLYYNNATSYAFSDAAASPSSIPFFCEYGGANLNSSASTLYDSVNGVYSWLLHEGSGTTTKDIEGGVTGTFVSSPTWTPGTFGQAIDFDGTDRITFTGEISNSGGWTVNTWVNRETTSSTDFIIDTGDCASVYYSGSYAHVFYRDSTSGYSRADGIPSDTTGWHMFTATYDSSDKKVRAYWDGALLATGGALTNGGKNCGTSSAIGARDGGAHPFDGKIEHIEVYHELKSTDWISRQFDVNRTRFGSEENQTNSSINVAISTGITNAIPSASIYSDAQVYVRYLNETQKVATFDRVALYGNQRWVFNYVNTGESYNNFDSISPALYFWENDSLTTDEIATQVQAYIEATMV